MKKAAIWLLSGLLCTIPTMIYAEDSTNEANYQKALEYMDLGHFDLACSIFELLGDYSDSETQRDKCKEHKEEMYYGRAVDRMELQEYDLAEDVFLMLGEYKDSAQLAAECETGKKQLLYDRANAYFERKEYQQAEEIFDYLGDFSDSAEKIEKIGQSIIGDKYVQALGFENDGEYEQAIEIYQEIEDFKDSSERIQNCRKQVEIIELKSRITSALYADEFQPADLYRMLKKASDYEFDEEEIKNWYTEAYDREMEEAYGADAMCLDDDFDSDGITERVISGNSVLAVKEKTAEGLAEQAEMPTEEEYRNLKLEKDLSGRTYLVASNNRMESVFLLGEAIVPIEKTEVAGGLEYTFTENGFKLKKILTTTPLRWKETEYAIDVSKQIEAEESPVIVDISGYPERDTALKLLKLYSSSRTFENAEERGLLVSERASEEEIASLDDWMDEHSAIEKADLILWNEEEEEFLAIIYSHQNQILVRLSFEEGQYKLIGLESGNQEG